MPSASDVARGDRVSEARHAAIWVSAASVATALISFTLSIHGSAFIGLSTGFRGLAAYDMGWVRLVALQAFGAALAFVLGLVAVRYWHASRELWFGALITSVLLAARLVVDPVGLWLSSARTGDGFAASGIQELVHGFPFVSPWAAVMAVVGYPLAVGLACWVARPRADTPNKGIE